MRLRSRHLVLGAAAALAALATSAVLGSPGFAAEPTATPTPSASGSTGPTTDPAPTVTGSTVPSPPTTGPTTTTCPVYAPATLGPDGVLVRKDFEDGTTQGWLGSGGASVAATTEQAASGSHSLRVTGLTTQNRVSMNVGRAADHGWYRVTAQVRSAPSVGSTFVELRTGTSTGTGVVRVSSTGWTTVTAWARPTTLYADYTCNGTFTGTQLPYLLGLDVTLSVTTCGEPPATEPTLYLDDVTVARADTGAGSSVPPGTTVTPPTPGSRVECPPDTPAQPTCSATHSVTSQWPGGYLGELRIVDRSGTPLRDWSVSWTFRGDHTVGSAWPGQAVGQSGRVVSVTGPAWSVVPTGEPLVLGYVAAGSSTPAGPSAVTLNGSPCLVVAPA